MHSDSIQFQYSLKNCATNKDVTLMQCDLSVGPAIHMPFVFMNMEDNHHRVCIEVLKRVVDIPYDIVRQPSYFEVFKLLFSGFRHTLNMHNTYVCCAPYQFD